MTRIIEWAIDITTSGIEPETPVLSEDEEATKAWPFLGSQEKKLKTFQLLSRVLNKGSPWGFYLF